MKKISTSLRGLSKARVNSSDADVTTDVDATSQGLAIVDSLLQGAEAITQAPGLLSRWQEGAEPARMSSAAHSLAAAAYFLDPVAALSMLGSTDEKHKRLRAQLVDVPEGSTAQIARDLVVTALAVDPLGAIDGLVSSSKISKLTEAGHEKVVIELARWLLAKPKILRKILPADLPAEIFVRKPAHHYVPDYYGASFRKLPNLAQMPVFGEIACRAVATGDTLLHLDRLYTLYNVLARFGAGELVGDGFGIAEVGVYKGGTSVFLAEAMQAFGLTQCSLHACDTFSGHAGVDVKTGTDRHIPGHFADTSADHVRGLLSGFPFAHVHEARIQDTVHLLPARFGLVHLDTDLYEPTLFGLEFFFDKLVCNGAIVVDDFSSKSCPGINHAVEEFAAAHSDAFILPMLTAQCLVMRSGSKS
jgi:hypothetical protein